MKFYIPYNEEINLDVIECDFMLKYYPEMATSDGKLFYWFGPKYVALEKNNFVYDFFTIKQKGDNTIIKTQRGQNRWFGLPFVNYFVAGDFYDDVNINFKKFLTRHYGYSESDILMKESWWEKYAKYILMCLGLNLIVLLLMIAIGVGMELIWNYSRDRGKVYTNTYAIEESVVDSTEYGPIYEYKLIHQPSHKVLLKSKNELEKTEINNYAIVEVLEESPSDYSYSYTLYSPEGDAVMKDSHNLSFFQADIIWSIHDYDEYFYNLDGTRTKAPFMYRYKWEIQNAIFIIVLLLFILVNVYTIRKFIQYIKKRKGKKGKKIVSTDSDETILN